ncbi:ester cyclase [Myxococcaceae bacterium GXIMD 01537]
MRNPTLMALALAALCGCATSTSASRARALAAANKELAVAFTEEVYNQRLLERIPDYVADDFVDHSQGAPEGARGPAFVRQQAEASLAAFDDLRFDIQHLVADEDLVLVHWKAAGLAKQRDASGQPRPVTLHGHSLFRVKDGKIVESWDISERPAQ